MLYAILKNFKKKLPLYSDFISDSAYRTKSSNLRHHADELLTSFHGLALSFDDLESTLTQAQTLLLYAEKDHTGKVLRETLNLQVGSSDRTKRYRDRIQGFNMEVEQMDRSIPYIDQIANKRMIGEQGLTIG